MVLLFSCHYGLAVVRCPVNCSVGDFLCNENAGYPVGVRYILFALTHSYPEVMQ